MNVRRFISKQAAILIALLLSATLTHAQVRLSLTQSCGVGSSTLSASSYQNYTGNGADGALTVSSATTINTVKTAVTGNNAAGSTTINVASTTGISAGDEILIITMQDANTSGNLVGQYEFREVASVTSTVITLYAGLTNTYNASSTLKHQVVRVPNYTTVTVNNTLTCPTWNGTTGGVLVFRSNGGVTISSNNAITATGLGYRGASHSCMYQMQYGTQGEGIYGTGTTTTSANANGGGGGGYNCPSCNTWDCGGGGGGGYVNAGSTGTVSASYTPGGTGGSSVSNSVVNRAYMGGAGGEGGADEDGAYPGAGGNGGGIIMIGASSITINNNANITSNGNNGLNGNQNACTGVGCGQGGGGGGAGGTIILQYTTLSTSGSCGITATGAGGGSGTCSGYGNGGTGSSGAIRIETSGTVATTTPSATSASLPSPTYLWSTGATTSTLSAVSSGNYGLTLNYGKIALHDTINVTLSTPSVSISSNQGTTICSGTSVTFTATPTTGGASPSYQWKKNGTNVGTNSVTYTDNALANNDVITCVMTSNATCITSATATSSGITMTVNASVTPSISVVASPSSTICSGTSVTFSATTTNPGSAPTYQWKKNGTSVGSSATTYTDNALANNDIITCVLTSNVACASSSTATSNGVTMTVNANLTPGVTISTNPSATICSGTSVTFSATPTNGGAAPVYQWKKNGTNVGTNSTTYTDNALANNDAITVVLTSNATCLAATTATSAATTMTVNANLTPAVSIASNNGASICSGTSTIFTATPTNGGASPAYQWKKNGTNVGTNSTTYTDNALANNDAITCVMTSNATCLTASTGTSTAITMTVNTNLTPSVSIASNSGSTICAGTNVTYTATPTNGGVSPSYQWKKNGTNIGTNASTYSNNTLANNDIISCVMTSNATCLTANTGTSNNITMTVNANVTPAISIASGSGTTICSGTSVTFTATPTNGGAAPTYQWKKNGTNVGSSSATYTDNALANNDAITCVLTSNATCPSPATATSAAVTMAVNPNLTPSVTIATSSTFPICSGTSVIFTATPTNGGSSPSFQWKKNGVNVGTNSTSYSINTLANSDVISCVLTSNATCLAASTGNSNNITATINATHWTGSVSNDWNNGGNWECGVVPTSGIDADIPSTCSQFPLIGSGTNTCRNLTIHSSCSVSINSGAKLNIEGTLDHNGSITGDGYVCFHGSSAQICKGNGRIDNCEHDNGSGTTINSGDSLHIIKTFKPTSGTFYTNGCLHFESDQNGTAQCLGGSSNYISGDVICHNYIHGGRRAFRFLAHPHSSSIPLSQLTDFIDITGNGGSANGFTTTNTNNPSSFWYDPTTGNGSSTNDPGWTAFTNVNGLGNNAWKPSEGALVMIRGSKGEGLCCGTYTIDPVTTRTHGPVNQGNVSVSCISNNNLGYNFIGNPYPSNIDLSLCTRGNAIGANFSVWDPNQGTQGAYVDQPFSFSYILPAYSSFFTTCTSSSNNSITFHETDKNKNSASGNLFKTTSGFGNDVVQLHILSNHDSLSWDRLLLFFNGQAMSGYDKLDNQKLQNPELTFYTFSTDATQLSIDVRPFVSNQVIQLGLQNAPAQNYDIVVDDYDVPAGAVLVLHDKYLSQTHTLFKGAHYNFDVTSDSASQGDNRFEINISGTVSSVNNVIASDNIKMDMMPNPATDVATISFEAPQAGATTLTLRSVTGQQILMNNLGEQKSGKVNIPLQGIPQGIYLVTINCGTFSITERLVKQ